MPEEASDQPKCPTIAVTGASGFVGRHVVAELLSRGCVVRALTTNQTRAWRVLPESPHLTVVQGDVLDSETRQDLLDGAESVVHLIGIHHERVRRGETFDRLHVRATSAMVESARTSGTRRFVHMSSLGVRNEAVSRYHRSKHRAEQFVRNSGLNWTILRPSLIHGRDGEFMQMATRWVTGGSPAKFVLPYFEALDKPQDLQRPGERARAARVQPIYVADVATAVCDTLARDQTIGEVYPLAGPEAITWPRLFELIRDNTPGANAGIKPWGVPAPVGLVVAHAFRLIGLGGLLPFSVDDVQMAVEDNCCSLAKAREDIGLDPVALAPTMQMYAGGAAGH